MNLFNDDFIDFIDSLNRHHVEYVLVGGYAVIIRGYSRTTGDIDLWVNRSPENYTKLIAAIVQFGLPEHAIPIEQFLSDEFDVFSFGRPPYSIEIMTAVKGLDFSETHLSATQEEIDGITVRVIHINQLKLAKKASGRNKDLNDLENLPE
jgi:predicted nucleotidyltransferase